jgi:cold shock CspA family protein
VSRGSGHVYTFGKARAGFSTAKEEQVAEFELVSNKGKTSAENLEIKH